MKNILIIFLVLFALCLHSQTLPILSEWDFTISSDEKDGMRMFEDVSGHGNSLEGRIGAASGDGLTLNCNELIIGHNQPLPFIDMRKAWEIQTTVKLGTTGTEQVFVCKEGRRNSTWGKNPAIPYLQGPTTVADVDWFRYETNVTP